MKRIVLLLAVLLLACNCGFYVGPHGLAVNVGDASVTVGAEGDEAGLKTLSGPISEGSAKNLGTIIGGVVAYFLRAPVQPAEHSHDHEHE